MSLKCNTDRVDNRYCCFFFVFWRNEFVVVASMPYLGAALFIILAQNLWWIVYIVLGKWFSWKIDLLCKQSGLLLSAATTSWSHSKLKLSMCREIITSDVKWVLLTIFFYGKMYHFNNNKHRLKDYPSHSLILRWI